MDVKKKGRRSYGIWTHNAGKPTGLAPVDFAKQVETLGAGEVVINSIDHDGVMKGYDLELVSEVREAIRLPMTVLGGAGSLKDIATLIHTFGIIGAAAGSLFVFKGVYRAVLINYPSRAEKDALITSRPSGSTDNRMKQTPPKPENRSNGNCGCAGTCCRAGTGPDSYITHPGICRHGANDRGFR